MQSLPLQLPCFAAVGFALGLFLRVSSLIAASAVLTLFSLIGSSRAGVAPLTAVGIALLSIALLQLGYLAGAWCRRHRSK